MLVSEVMLQQTQVARVERFWSRFLSVFPTLDALAMASTAEVLELWQGLGYNRRALALKKTAEICSAQGEGKLPRTEEELRTLPGIGMATAAGICAFAYQKPASYLETNVRTVFLHDLFPKDEGVKDHELLPLIRLTCSKEDPRGWYYALLDYGAWLKTQGDKSGRRSAHYARQSSFEGSRRQKRSFILQSVLGASSPLEEAQVLDRLNQHEREAGRDQVDPKLFEDIVEDLIHEGFVKRESQGLWV